MWRPATPLLKICNRRMSLGWSRLDQVWVWECVFLWDASDGDYQMKVEKYNTEYNRTPDLSVIERRATLKASNTR